MPTDIRYHSAVRFERDLHWLGDRFPHRLPATAGSPRAVARSDYP
jgi:hypothetical protein